MSRLLTDEEILSSREGAKEFLDIFPSSREIDIAIQKATAKAQHDLDTAHWQGRLKELFAEFDEWCTHTTNPLQRKSLCSACRRELKEKYLGEKDE